MEHPEVKKKKLRKSLNTSVSMRRKGKFLQVRVAAYCKFVQWQRWHVRVMDWAGWRERMMTYLSKHIWGGGHLESHGRRPALH